jgi:hypothetical protein
MTVSSSAWLGAALVVFACVPAHADSAAPLPSEEKVNAARVLYHDARELERAGKVKEALEKALQAYDTAATPVTALEVATLLVQTQRLVEARNMARSIATMPISPRESDKGREARQQAASLADALDARIPKIAEASAPAAPLPTPPISHPWRPVSWIMVGLGVAAVGVGAVLAIVAKTNYESVAPQCNHGCTLTAFNTRNKARSLADVATDVIVPGAAAFAAGAFLWIGDPGRTRVQVAIGPASVGLVVPLR